MIRTQIQITEEQARQLKMVAAQEQKSVAEVIREGIDLTLRRRAGIDEEILRRRAIEIAGKYQSGVTDLSEAHDRYLAEAWEA